MTRRRKSSPAPQTITDGTLAAREARLKSRDGFLAAVDQAAEGRLLADRVRERSHRNHFSELLQESMGWKYK